MVESTAVVGKGLLLRDPSPRTALVQLPNQLVGFSGSSEQFQAGGSYTGATPPGSLGSLESLVRARQPCLGGCGVPTKKARLYKSRNSSSDIGPARRFPESVSVTDTKEGFVTRDNPQFF